MMPSNMGGGSSGAKHQQQLIQSVSLLPTPYGFLPSVFGGASLDMPLLGSVDPVCFSYPCMVGNSNAQFSCALAHFIYAIKYAFCTHYEGVLLFLGPPTALL